MHGWMLVGKETRIYESVDQRCIWADNEVEERILRRSKAL